MAVMIKKVGVIGSGQMGNGIAHVAALAGFDVVLNDVSADRLKSGMATINGNLSRQVSKKIITEEARKQALNRIVSTETIEGLADCDLAIESATEKEEIKRRIFHDVCAVLKPDAIVASNTSSISITRLAASTDRPERFIGIHFMNPVPLMELVELIRGIATDDSTFEASKAFVARLGKQIAVSEDFPAFIVNRILLPMINEAIYTLYEGVGNVEAIDAAMKLGAHHPMGPLELADFIGLDTCLSIMQVLHEGLADSKYRPCPLLVKYVEAGWLGRKTQRGFYDYRGEKPVPTREGGEKKEPEGGLELAFGPRRPECSADQRHPVRTCPFRRPGNGADLATGWINEERRRHPDGAPDCFQVLKNPGAGIGVIGELVHSAVPQPGARFLGIARIDIDGDHFKARSAAPLLERVERRHLLAARHAPGCPQIEEHGTPTPLREIALAGICIAKTQIRHCHAAFGYRECGEFAMRQRRNTARKLKGGAAARL